MMKKLSTPNTAFTLLQVLTVLIAVIGVGLAVLLLQVGVSAIALGAAGVGLPPFSWWTLLITGFASVAVVSICCAVALYTFFRLCGRMKQGSAFTRPNERAMGRIALCCLIAGLTLAAGCAVLKIADLLGGCVMGLYWFEMAAMAFIFLSVSLVAWALCLLVRRAIPLQEDADLTI